MHASPFSDDNPWERHPTRVEMGRNVPEPARRGPLAMVRNATNRTEATNEATRRAAEKEARSREAEEAATVRWFSLEQWNQAGGLLLFRYGKTVQTLKLE